MLLFEAKRRLSEVEARLSTVLDDLRRLQSEMKDRDLAWEEMRARCKRLLDRTEKDYRAIDKTEEPPEVKIPDGVISPSPDRLNRIREQLAARGRRSA